MSYENRQNRQNRHASIDYQKRAEGFSIGDLVAPYGTPDSWGGIVVRVFPAIGMVDVEFPDRMQRLPVESLQNFTKIRTPLQTTFTGDEDLYPVSTRMASRDKQALYWTAPDRKHRAKKSELTSGKFTCPKCRTVEGDCVTLVNRILSRQEGKNFKILVCPQCTFAIQRSDIVNSGE
jgi:hypothetical protein